MRQVLKYPGSKWKIAGQLAELIPPHHSYVEPFFGSGALLFNKPPSAIETINDLDSDVVNLFSCIQEDADRLARLIMTTPFSREVYDNAFEYEDSVTEAIREDPYQKSLVFLTKCWQGHGFRSNGYKVGWKNDVQGRESMYALWNWYRLPEWVMDIAERLRKVQIENRPAIEVIERFNYPNVFQYWDPPYLLGTRSGKQYKFEMSDSDHEELLKKALRSKAKIMISGYDSDLYNDYLKGWQKEYFKELTEYGSKRQEVVWMNYEQYRQNNIFDMLEE